MRRIDDTQLTGVQRRKLMYVEANSLGQDDQYFADWCEKNIRGHYGIKRVASGLVAYFDDPADALYFNLRFF